MDGSLRRMLPHAWPQPVDGAYSRASLQRFLDDAEAASGRLEAEIGIAHQRRRLLQAELAEVLERNARVARELEDTTREIRSDRTSQGNVVAVILAAAEAEAAALLTRASEEAAAIRAAGGRPTIRSADPVTPPPLVLVQGANDRAVPSNPPLLVG